MINWKSKYPDGVYLGLSNEEYHADPAIGSSGIKALLKSPLDFWYNSWMNPEKPEKKSSPAMKLGTAYHTLILEPDKFSYEIIDGTKTTSKDGCLAEAEHTSLKAMQAMLNSKPYHAALFKGGYSEVSIFWTDKETGIPCKCRFDYWKPHFVTDLKTTTSIEDKNVRYQVRDFGYQISAAMYMTGTNYLREMIKSGNCAGIESFDKKFIDDFASAETRFVFLMQEKETPYDTRGLVINEANDDFYNGLVIAKQQWDLFGDKQWASPYQQIEDFLIY
jgi:hypothetical protein